MSFFGAVIMRVNFEPEPDFLQHRIGLMAARVTGLLG
jgi:hypothetical protein